MGMHSYSIRGMLDHARTALLFVGKQLILRRKLWLPAVSDVREDTGCPVICFDHDCSEPLWELSCGRSAAAASNAVIVVFQSLCAERAQRRWLMHVTC